jgi:hypothetical protein
MNAEYTYSGKLAQFTVTAQNGYPPRTTKISERSTCGKYILERVLMLDSYDVMREVAIYSVLGTAKRPV